jgi:hypothetical protein
MKREGAGVAVWGQDRAAGQAATNSFHFWTM